jgi:hypothetical protein
VWEKERRILEERQELKKDIDVERKWNKMKKLQSEIMKFKGSGRQRKR